MQTTATQPAGYGLTREQGRHYRVERQFSAQRQLREFLRDLLRAHCGE